MKYLKKNNDKKYEKQFSNFLKNGITAETDFVKLYTSVHKAIRENPAPIKKKEVVKGKDFSKKRLTLQQKKIKLKS